MEDKNQTSTATGASTGDTNQSTTATSNTVSEVVTTTTAVTESPTTATPTETVVAQTSTETPVSVPEMVSTPDVESAPVVASSPRSSALKQYAIAFGIVLVMAGGVTYVLIQQGRIQTPAVFAKVVDMVHPAPAAAVVNGVKISMADYIKNKTQVEQSATQSGVDIASDTVKAQIKTQALDVLINTEVLRQAAVKDGITVTDDQIKTRYDDIVKSLQGEDKLNAKMIELGITKEGLMKDISSEILIQTYLAKAVNTNDIKISDDDIKAAYDQANTNPDSKLPPLDKVKSAIEAQLKQAKQQQLINDFIQKLRDAAKIETNV
jgi:hypothetical protein